MITLAIGVAFYYLVLQNYAVFNGFQGKQKVFPPTLAGIYWRDPTPFYYLTLACALAGYLFVVYLMRTPFGSRSKAFATTRAGCTRWAST